MSQCRSQNCVQHLNWMWFVAKRTHRLTRARTRSRTTDEWLAKFEATKTQNENEMERKETEKSAICFPRTIIRFTIVINYNYTFGTARVAALNVLTKNSADAKCLVGSRILANCCVNHCHEIFCSQPFETFAHFHRLLWYPNCLFSCSADANIQI